MVCECVCEFVCIPHSASKKILISYIVVFPLFFHLFWQPHLSICTYGLGAFFVRRFLKLLLVLHDRTISTYYYPEQDTNYYVTQQVKYNYTASIYIPYYIYVYILCLVSSSAPCMLLTADYTEENGTTTSIDKNGGSRALKVAMISYYIYLTREQKRSPYYALIFQLVTTRVVSSNNTVVERRFIFDYDADINYQYYYSMLQIVGLFFLLLYCI